MESKKDVEAGHTSTTGACCSRRQILFFLAIICSFGMLFYAYLSAADFHVKLVPASFSRIYFKFTKASSSSSAVNGSKENTSNSTSKNVTYAFEFSISEAFAGRLGNRLFQYAGLYGIATMNNMSAVVPRHLSLHSTFPNLRAVETNVPRDWKVVNVPKSMTYSSSVSGIWQHRENILLHGYLASWRYFDHVRDDIRQQFVFADRYLDAVQGFLRRQLTPSDPTFIGIHVRRGDVLRSAVQAKGYVITDMSYLRRAMDYYEAKYKNIVFVVCSDDKAWVVKNVKSNNSLVLYSPFKDPQSDMCLLTQCNHTIISVGTFSWWAGWLAGGDVVYNKGFPLKGSPIWRDYTLGDYYPSGWVGL